jgi:hypothetical protein
MKTYFFDPGLSSVVTIYSGFLKHDAFKEICLGALETAQTHQLSKILVDTSHLKVMLKESQQWIEDVWFPRAKQIGIKHMAFLVPEDIFGRMSMEATNKKEEQEGDIDIRYFDNAAEAKLWLKHI